MKPYLLLPLALHSAKTQGYIWIFIAVRSITMEVPGRPCTIAAIVVIHHRRKGLVFISYICLSGGLMCP